MMIAAFTYCAAAAWWLLHRRHPVLGAAFLVGLGLALAIGWLLT